MPQRNPAFQSNFFDRVTSLVLRVLEFFVPGHLNGFETGLIGLGRVVGEAGQLRDIAVQVCKAHGQGVEVGKLLLQLNADFFGVGPQNLARHGLLLEYFVA